MSFRISARLVVSALLACAFATSVAAQASVVLVRPPAGDAQLTDAFNRLEAELHIHAFETQIQEPEFELLSAAALSDMAESAGAVGGFAFVRHDGAATLEVALFDRNTGEPSTRSLVLERGNDAASLIAVRAVDMLRSSQQDFPDDAQSPPPEPPAAIPEPSSEPPPSAAQEPRAPSFSLAAEGTLLWPGDRFGIAFGPALGFFHHPSASFRWGVWLAAPVLGTSLETSQGDATVRQELGFVEARLSVLRARRFEFGPLAGLGVFLLQASGRAAREPLRSQSDGVWSGLAVLGVYAEQGLTDAFGVGLSLRALGLVPGLGVAVASEREALSLPTLQAALGVTVGF